MGGSKIDQVLCPLEKGIENKGNMQPNPANFFENGGGT